MHAGAGRQSVLPAPFVRTLPGGSGAVVGARPSIPAPTWAAPGQRAPGASSTALGARFHVLSESHMGGLACLEPWKGGWG